VRRLNGMNLEPIGELLLGIDLGTSLIKVGAFTSSGVQVCLHTAPTPITWDGPEQAHHDPLELWEVVCTLLRQVMLEVNPKRLVCIGISSFGEAGVLVSSDGRPQTPILAWFDTRPKGMLEGIDLQALRRKTGVPGDHTYSLSKILWHAKQLEVTGLIWLSTADWIAYQLTGKFQMGVTQASRTLLFDLRSQTWLTDVLQDRGLPMDVLAPIRLPGEQIGTVTSQASSQTGLPLGLPVMEAAHDQACAAAGVGAIEPGVFLNACGTVETIFTTLEKNDLNAVLETESVVLGHHALTGRYWAMATMRASGSVFDWAIRLTNKLEPGSKISSIDYQHALEAASRIEADELKFIPHLRQISDDPRATSLPGGVFLGLRETHTHGHLIRAVLEGLSLEAAGLLERFGVIPEDALIRAVGGPSRNPIWMQLKANFYNLPLEVCSVTNASTWGAAWLAWHHLNAARGETFPASQINRDTLYQPEISAEEVTKARAKYSSQVQSLKRTLESDPTPVD
jgi:sugar (pentulose or hexulose) kinase